VAVVAVYVLLEAMTTSALVVLEVAAMEVMVEMWVFLVLPILEGAVVVLDLHPIKQGALAVQES
jgi:hypothetical protein